MKALHYFRFFITFFFLFLQACFASLNDPDILSNQSRLTLKQSVVDQEFPLNRPDIKIPHTSISSFNTEIAIRVDKETRTLRFDQLQLDPSTGTFHPTNAHVFHDIEVAGNVIANKNFIAFATVRDGKAEGVRFIMTKYFKAFGFMAPVPAFLAVPLDLEDGETIEHIEFLNRDSHIEHIEHEVLGGDLLITTRKADGREEHRWVSLETFTMNLRIRKLHFLLQMQIVNPNPKEQKLISAVIEQNQRDVLAIRDSAAEILTTDKADLTRMAIVAAAQRSGAAFIADLFDFKKYPQGDVFKWLTAEERDRFSANMVESLDDATQKIGDFEKKRASTLSRIKKRVDRLAAKLTQPKSLKLLAAALAGVSIAHIVTGGDELALGARLGSQIIDACLKIPGLGLLGQSVIDGFHYFKNKDAISAWLPGAGVMLSLYTLSYLGSYAAAYIDYLRGRGPPIPFKWKAMATEFHNRMTRTYGVLNNIHAMVYSSVNQPNVVRAMDSNADLSRTPYLLNRYSASQKQIDQNAEAINNNIAENASERAIAEKLAAAALASEHFGVDIATLFMCEDGELKECTPRNPVNLAQRYNEVHALTDVMADPKLAARWQDLTQKIYRALVQLVDDQSITLSDDFHTHQERYFELANKIKKQTDSQGRASQIVSTLFLQAKTFFSRTVLHYLLFNEEGRKLYLRLKGVKLDPTTVQISRGLNEAEWHIAGLYFSWVAAQDYAWPPHPRIWADQGGSLLVYGGQIPADILPTIDAHGLSNTHPPPTNLWFDPKEKQHVRPQTFAEARRNIATKTLDPDSSAKGLLETYSQYIINLKDGLPARLVYTGLPLFLAYQVTGTPRSAFLAALYLLLRKLAINVHDGKIRPGLAFPVPIVNQWILYGIEITEDNLKRINRAVAWVEQGLRLKNRTRLENGIHQMQALYTEGGSPLPEYLQKDATLFTDEDAKALLNHLMSQQLPLPTVPSPVMNHFLNLGFAMTIMTILENEASQEVFEKQGSALIELGQSVASLTGLYGALHLITKYVRTPVLKGIRSLCNLALQPSPGK